MVELQIHALISLCEVRVVDDGTGIAEGTSRSGLLNLERRATENGGAFEIHRRPTGGTEAIWKVRL